MLGELAERGRRRWAATAARSSGRGGIAAVAESTGMFDRTIRAGIRERQGPQKLPPGRQLRPKGGRNRHNEEQPQLIAAQERPVCPVTRRKPFERRAVAQATGVRLAVQPRNPRREWTAYSSSLRIQTCGCARTEYRLCDLLFANVVSAYLVGPGHPAYSDGSLR